MHADDLDAKMASLDFSQAKPVSEVPALARLQGKRRDEKGQLEQANPLEPDVWQLILKKADNATEIARVNQVLRAMLA